MLGHKLVQLLSDKHDVYCSIRGSLEPLAQYDILKRGRVVEDLDVRNFECVRGTIEVCRPEVVVNATGVVKQLLSSRDVIDTLTINSIFPHKLAELSSSYGFRLITVSTDCVFAGTLGSYTEDSVPDAADLYGQSKHWGEIDRDNCVTIRTSIIGRELSSSHGLLEWLISHRGGKVCGYSKAIFSGFPTLIFADIIDDIIQRHRGLAGIFHVSSDPISKFELLTKINNKLELGVEIAEDADLAIDRSLNSSKYRQMTGFSPLMWDEMIEQMAADTALYDRWKDRKH